MENRPDRRDHEDPNADRADTGAGGYDGPDTRIVLSVLADLAPSAEQRSAPLTVPTEWFKWLPLSALTLVDPSAGTFGPGVHTAAEVEMRTPSFAIERRFGDRLAAIDVLRPEHRSLRVGWLFLTGRAELADGRTRRWFAPLVEAPVRIARTPGIGRPRVTIAGDVEVTPLVTDDDLRHELERTMEFGGGTLHTVKSEVAPTQLLGMMPRLQKWANAAAAGAGLPAGPLVPATDEPERMARRRKPVVVAGLAIYSTHEEGGLGRSSSLRTWADRRIDRPTALDAMYLAGVVDDRSPSKADPGRDLDAPATGGRAGSDHGTNEVVSPFVLTPAQQRAVVASRTRRVSVLSGAPGTGKSHTLVAIAADALHRGESVLVAAKSDAAVDALLDLLERAPGVDPVVFGSSEKRDALAERMSAGQPSATSVRAVEITRAHLAKADGAVQHHRRALTSMLAAEVSLTDGEAHALDAFVCRWAPRILDEPARLDEARAHLAAVGSEAATGLVGRWRQRRHLRRVGETLGTEHLPTSTFDAGSLESVTRALDAVGTVRDVRAIEAAGGLDIAIGWDELVAAEDERRRAMGELLRVESRSSERMTTNALRMVGALATALRSGRGARRQQLERLDGPSLYRLFPLWIGTLADVDDLLPHVAAAFDLVILDEASSVDQPLAAAALVRAKRAVVAGDPRQLRHVSFLADSRLREVADTYGLQRWPSLAAALDVRRNSAFDVAAGVAPAQVLDEHFRSAPALIEHVAREVYDGTVTVATRRPSTARRHCVAIERLDGERNRDGVVDAEVRRVLALIRTARGRGERDLGVVTPFRAQADAIEAAVLATFTADDIQALDLRIGTVHAFQGNERRHVIVSIGAGAEATAGTWRFVDDPRLFVVMMTRAREQLTILLTGAPPAGGLLATYLEQAESTATPTGESRRAAVTTRPTGRSRRADETGGAGAWTRRVAEGLTSVGLDATTGYATGRHAVDVVLIRPTVNGDDVAFDCEVLDGDPAAHIDRHLALRRGGWKVRDAYASRWQHRLGELLVDLKSAPDLEGAHE